MAVRSSQKVTFEQYLVPSRSSIRSSSSMTASSSSISSASSSSFSPTSSSSSSFSSHPDLSLKLGLTYSAGSDPNRNDNSCILLDNRVQPEANNLISNGLSTDTTKFESSKPNALCLNNRPSSSQQSYSQRVKSVTRDVAFKDKTSVPTSLPIPPSSPTSSGSGGLKPLRSYRNILLTNQSLPTSADDGKESSGLTQKSQNTGKKLLSAPKSRTNQDSSLIMERENELTPPGEKLLSGLEKSLARVSHGEKTATRVVEKNVSSRKVEKTAPREGGMDIPRVSLNRSTSHPLPSHNIPLMQAGKLDGKSELYCKLKMESYLTSIDIKDSRFSILTYEQVKRLSGLMNDNIPIHGRGNFPTLEVKLVDLVVLVKSKLEAAGVPVKEIRLNGSGASSVLASECNISYNDLDLIFSVDLTSQKQYEQVKQVVLDSLLDLLPEGTSKKRMSASTLKEAYVSKMVKVNENDRWSLIALGNNRTKSVELKFVDQMRRKYEFSVDSFHIILDTLFLFYECAKMSISENFYPTVLGESVYGDFDEALYHLQQKLIATKHPEEIRGGGLLKYCNLLVKNYRPALPEQVKGMERYMCSRFFIDFPDLTQQENKLIKFLDNHFLGAGDQLKYDYLMILYQVVDESTVCLMGHERRQTLALIQHLSCNVFLPYEDPISSSSTAWCVTSHLIQSHPSHTQSSHLITSHPQISHPPPSSHPPPPTSSHPPPSSHLSSGQCSPMSTSSSSPSLSPKPCEDWGLGGGVVDFTVPPPRITISPSIPPIQPGIEMTKQTITFQQVQPGAVTPLNQPSQCSLPSQTNIPTYEIITSCQPRVLYSNGYYFTTFPNPGSTNTTSYPDTSASSAPCYTCSCSCQGSLQWTISPNQTT